MIDYLAQVLLCGDREGTIYCFDYHDARGAGAEAEGSGPSEAEVLRATLPCCAVSAHGKQSVTEICIHRGRVYSTGRDGSFCQFE